MGLLFEKILHKIALKKVAISTEIKLFPDKIPEKLEYYEKNQIKEYILKNKLFTSDFYSNFIDPSPIRSPSKIDPKINEPAIKSIFTYLEKIKTPLKVEDNKNLTEDENLFIVALQYLKELIKKPEKTVMKDIHEKETEYSWFKEFLKEQDIPSSAFQKSDVLKVVSDILNKIPEEKQEDRINILKRKLKIIFSNNKLNEAFKKFTEEQVPEKLIKVLKVIYKKLGEPESNIKMKVSKDVAQERRKLQSVFLHGKENPSDEEVLNNNQRIEYFRKYLTEKQKSILELYKKYNAENKKAIEERETFLNEVDNSTTIPKEYAKDILPTLKDIILRTPVEKMKSVIVRTMVPNHERILQKIEKDKQHDFSMEFDQQDKVKEYIEKTQKYIIQFEKSLKDKKIPIKDIQKQVSNKKKEFESKLQQERNKFVRNKSLKYLEDTDFKDIITDIHHEKQPDINIKSDSEAQKLINILLHAVENAPVGKEEKKDFHHIFTILENHFDSHGEGFKRLQKEIREDDLDIKDFKLILNIMKNKKYTNYDTFINDLKGLREAPETPSALSETDPEFYGTRAKSDLDLLEMLKKRNPDGYEKSYFKFIEDFYKVLSVHSLAKNDEVTNMQIAFILPDMVENLKFLVSKTGGSSTVKRLNPPLYQLSENAQKLLTNFKQITKPLSKKEFLFDYAVPEHYLDYKAEHKNPSDEQIINDLHLTKEQLQKIKKDEREQKNLLHELTKTYEDIPFIKDEHGKLWLNTKSLGWQTMSKKEINDMNKLNYKERHKDETYEKRECILCEGTGKLDIGIEDKHDKELNVKEEKCPQCNGTGYVPGYWEIYDRILKNNKQALLNEYFTKTEGEGSPFSKDIQELMKEHEHLSNDFWAEIWKDFSEVGKTAATEEISEEIKKYKEPVLHRLKEKRDEFIDKKVKDIFSEEFFIPTKKIKGEDENYQIVKVNADELGENDWYSALLSKKFSETKDVEDIKSIYDRHTYWNIINNHIKDWVHWKETEKFKSTLNVLKKHNSPFKKFLDRAELNNPNMLTHETIPENQTHALDIVKPNLEKIKKLEEERIKLEEEEKKAASIQLKYSDSLQGKLEKAIEKAPNNFIRIELSKIKNKLV